MDGEYIVIEVCPHCENEIEMRWSVEEFGYKAFCPVCGNRLMLCDECQHGEGAIPCDYDKDTDSCRFNKEIGGAESGCNGREGSGSEESEKEYFVELYRDGSFAFQLDSFSSYEEALGYAIAEVRSIGEGQEMHITTVEYDEAGNETEISSEVVDPEKGKRVKKVSELKPGDKIRQDGVVFTVKHIFDRDGMTSIQFEDVPCTPETMSAYGKLLKLSAQAIKKRRENEVE